MNMDERGRRKAIIERQKVEETTETLGEFHQMIHYGVGLYCRSPSPPPLSPLWNFSDQSLPLLPQIVGQSSRYHTSTKEKPHVIQDSAALPLIAKCEKKIPFVDACKLVFQEIEQLERSIKWVYLRFDYGWNESPNVDVWVEKALAIADDAMKVIVTGGSPPRELFSILRSFWKIFLTSTGLETGKHGMACKVDCDSFDQTLLKPVFPPYNAEWLTENRADIPARIWRQFSIIWLVSALDPQYNSSLGNLKRKASAFLRDSRKMLAQCPSLQLLYDDLKLSIKNIKFDYDQLVEEILYYRASAINQGSILRPAHATETLGVGDSCVNKGRYAIDENNSHPFSTTQDMTITKEYQNGLLSVAGDQVIEAYSGLDIGNHIVGTACHASENGLMLSSENKEEMTTFEVEVAAYKRSSNDGRKDIDDQKRPHILETGEMEGTSQNKQAKAKKLTWQDIQTSLTQGMKLEDAAKRHGVSRSTFKRFCRRKGIKRWTKTKKENCGSMKKREHSPNSSKAAELSQPNWAAPTCLTCDKRLQEIWEACRNQHCLSRLTTLDYHEIPPNKMIKMIEEKEGSSSWFTVKATSKTTEKTIRFDFSSTSTFDQLKREVTFRLNLKVGKFEIQYLDEDDDWVLMTCEEDLQYCLCLSSFYGKHLIKLQILDM